MVANEAVDPVEEFLAARIRSLLAGRPWLTVADVDQAAAGMGARLVDLGAEDVIAIGVSSGTGPIADGVPLISLGVVTSGSMMDGIRLGGRVARDLPAPVLARLDEWDPDRRARVIVPFSWSAFEIDGRPTWGARPATWEELEDKVVASAIWDEAGIERAPDAVVDLDDEGALRSAHRALSDGRGTVWAGDSHEGWHGGATSVRWAVDESLVPRLAAELAARHRQVRVMPFLDGIPCSIHGMVVGDRVVAFRPCEMIVLRDPAAGRFHYAAVATYWDPPDVVREEMRTVARAVGEVLRRRVGFRGAFTVDGVVTADGFRPTELNARLGSALNLLGRSRAAVPVFVTNCAVVAGELDDLDVEAFEAWMVSAADEQRQARSMFFVDRPPPDGERSMALELLPDGTVVEADREQADEPTIVAWGAAPSGGTVAVAFGAGLPVGRPVAPYAAAIAELVERRWRVGLPTLEAATVPS